MPRKPSNFPKDPAEYHRFGHFIWWHLFEHGSRPDGDPSQEIGQPWTMDEICNALGEIDPRTIRNWYNETHLPDSIVPFSRVVFGTGRQWDQQRRQLHELLRVAHESRNKEPVQPQSEATVGDEEPTDEQTSEEAQPTRGTEEEGDASTPSAEPQAEPPTASQPDASEQEVSPPSPEDEASIPPTAETSFEPEAAPTKDEQPAKVLLPTVVASRTSRPDARRTLARWIVGIGLVIFIGEYLWHRWPHDLHFPKVTLFLPAPLPLTSPDNRPPTTPQPNAPKSPPGPAPSATPEFKAPLIPVPVPLKPPPPVPMPGLPEAASTKPLEKALACIVGDPDVRELVAAELKRTTRGRVASGDCSMVEGPIVSVTGAATNPPKGDEPCDTNDRHLYTLVFSISRPGNSPDVSRTVSATRCASRIRDEDSVLGRQARNEAVLLGAISLRDLLQHLSEN
jgi:hypothetical protein